MRALFCLRANKTAEDFPTRVPTHGIFHLFPNSWLSGCSIHPIAAGGRGGGRRVRPAPRLHGLRQERNGGSSQEEEEGGGGGPSERSRPQREARRGGAGWAREAWRGERCPRSGADRRVPCAARRPGLARWLSMRGLCRRLCLVAAVLGLCGGSRNCPDLIVDRCLCAAERAKGPGRPALRIKVVCSGGDLVETLQPAVLPNRTVSL